MKRSRWWCGRSSSSVELASGGDRERGELAGAGANELLLRPAHLIDASPNELHALAHRIATRHHTRYDRAQHLYGACSRSPPRPHRARTTGDAAEILVELTNERVEFGGPTAHQPPDNSLGRRRDRRHVNCARVAALDARTGPGVGDVAMADVNTAIIRRVSQESGVVR